jgi:hypothetical protein
LRLTRKQIVIVVPFENITQVSGWFRRCDY